MYTSRNVRIAGGQSNVVESVESAHSSDNRGLWAQTNKLVVSGGSFHHNNADGIDLAATVQCSTGQRARAKPVPCRLPGAHAALPFVLPDGASRVPLAARPWPAVRHM